MANEFAVKTIFTSWNYDAHLDHVATYAYACMAARKTGASLFSYPVWAWMLPPATLVPKLRLKGFSLDIRDAVADKRAAVLKHRSQTSPLIDDDPSAPLWPFCSQAKPLLIKPLAQEHALVEGF